MAKPATREGYKDEYTADCERVLVTLLRGLGPWKDSVFLVGGLTPRYLVPARPPAVPPHAGTLDVDVASLPQHGAARARSDAICGACRDGEDI
jgi:hypothetical protein